MTGENKHLSSSIPLASVKFLKVAKYSVAMSMRSSVAIIQPTFVYNFTVACTKLEKRRPLKNTWKKNFSSGMNAVVRVSHYEYLHTARDSDELSEQKDVFLLYIAVKVKDAHLEKLCYEVRICTYGFEATCDYH